MSWREDRDEINNGGWRGLLRRAMATKGEVFIKLNPGEWTGELIATRPAPGSGPYIHWRQGEHIWQHTNATATDTSRQMMRLDV